MPQYAVRQVVESSDKRLLEAHRRWASETHGQHQTAVLGHLNQAAQLALPVPILCTDFSTREIRKYTPKWVIIGQY